jgi:O-acetyl-ADP-ribose deacetylase (regulator of RNase III)
MIEIKDGNLLAKNNDGIICNLVNCVASMNGGLALQIKLAYPKVYDTYRTYCEVNKFDFVKMLGTMMPIWVDGKCIVNLFGQTTYGIGACFINYKALNTGLTKLARYAKSIKLDVAMPWGMGARDGGGDWQVIYNIIESAFKDYKVTLYKGGDW